MRVRRLDENGDYVFGGDQGSFHHDNADGVAQEIMTRLRLMTGEWFADLTEGTNWAGGVLGERTAGTRDAIVRDRVLDTQGVLTIDRWFSALDPTTREWSVAMTVSTIYGPVALGVVRLAGGLPEGAFPPDAQPPGHGALLGVLATGGTELTMRPADLRFGPRADITDFVIVGIDAGVS
jgi:hypothetical protein